MFFLAPVLALIFLDFVLQKIPCSRSSCLWNFNKFQGWTLLSNQPSLLLTQVKYQNKISVKRYYVSQFTVETYCLLTVGVYSSNHRVLYTIGISMTRRYQKSVSPSVCLSVCPFVTLTKKVYSSFIINSREIICISGERAYNPLQENEAIFSK